MDLNGPDHLELVVDSACRLAGGDTAVRSVCVVGGRRLTTAELLRSHERAGTYGVRLTMDAAGVVTLRTRFPRAGDDACPRRRGARGLRVLPPMVPRRAAPAGVGRSRKG
jgi:hypothetical protein